MSRRPTVTVVIDGFSSLVSGYGTREMIEKIKGSPPVWSHVRKGWVVQESTARDVVALAEATFCDIVITGSRAHRSSSPAEVQAPDLREQHSDPGRGLW